MNIQTIAESVWNNCIEMPFGETTQWCETMFTQAWYRTLGDFGNTHYGFPGWYWFLADITYEEMIKINKPPALPINGCDIRAVSMNNISSLGIPLLCPKIEDFVVVYNGHETNVMARLRAHFNLNNNGTGAIGIKYYPLFNKKWKAKMFTEQDIDFLPDEIKDAVSGLIKSATGRCFVESAWRVGNGWPGLCKQ